MSNSIGNSNNSIGNSNKVINSGHFYNKIYISSTVVSTRRFTRYVHIH